MAILDLMSMSRPQPEQRKIIDKIMGNLQEAVPGYCFQCGKCTSGCESMKLLELEPHQIMAKVKNGFIDELVNSDIIWTCMTCLKCKERCPQNVSPVDVLFALKNIAITSGKQIPGEYSAMFQSVLETGLIQSEQEVVRRAGSAAVDRIDLGLKTSPKPTDMAKFQEVLMGVAMELLDR